MNANFVNSLLLFLSLILGKNVQTSFTDDSTVCQSCENFNLENKLILACAYLCELTWNNQLPGQWCSVMFRQIPNGVSLNWRLILPEVKGVFEYWEFFLFFIHGSCILPSFVTEIFQLPWKTLSNALLSQDSTVTLHFHRILSDIQPTYCYNLRTDMIKWNGRLYNVIPLQWPWLVWDCTAVNTFSGYSSGCVCWWNVGRFCPLLSSKLTKMLVF